MVEDEESLQDIIRLNLELEGYVVTAVGNGRKALEEFARAQFDLVVLDVMLPEVDGFTICQTIRLSNRVVPILFLTAKNSAEDRVFGLRIGGDDYLSKPFNLEEMLLRVKRLIDRNDRTLPDEVKIGQGRVRFANFEAVAADGSTQQLSQREVKLLRLFIDKQGEVLARDEMLEAILGHDADVTTRTIDNYLVNFRRLFEKDQREPRHFLSVRGVGYRYVD